MEEVLTSACWTLELLLPFLQGIPSTIGGNGCSGKSTPTRALDELALLDWSPFIVDVEHVVSLLSADCEVTRLGRDFDRRCRLASFTLFPCWGTCDGAALAVVLEPMGFPMRECLIVFQVEPATGGGEGNP